MAGAEPQICLALAEHSVQEGAACRCQRMEWREGQIRAAFQREPGRGHLKGPIQAVHSDRLSSRPNQGEMPLCDNVTVPNIIPPVSSFDDTLLQHGLVDSGIGTWDLNLATRTLALSPTTRKMIALSPDEDIDYARFL